MAERRAYTCVDCGSLELQLVEVIPGEYWRKQCAGCGSTGPFAPVTDCSIPSCPNRARVGAFCTPHYYERSAAERSMRLSLLPTEGMETSA